MKESCLFVAENVETFNLNILGRLMALQQFFSRVDRKIYLKALTLRFSVFREYRKRPVA